MVKNTNFNKVYDPKRCWVGDQHKICYSTKEEAEADACVAEYDHHLDTRLSFYK